MTPVPGAAGRSNTTPAAASPVIGCGIVPWMRGTRKKLLLRLFNALRNGGRDFLGFAVAHSHDAVTVANDNKRGEAEATTTLDDLRDPVDRRQRARGDLTSPRAASAPCGPGARRLRVGATFQTCVTSFARRDVSEGPGRFRERPRRGPRRDRGTGLAPAVEDNRVQCRRLSLAQRPIGRPCEPLQSCRHQGPRSSDSIVDAEASV